VAGCCEVDWSQQVKNFSRWSKLLLALLRGRKDSGVQLHNSADMIANNNSGRSQIGSRKGSVDSWKKSMCEGPAELLGLR
jgi:hypothetical protein